MVILAKRVQELEVHLSEHDAALQRLDRAPGVTVKFARRLREMLRLRKAREVRTTRISATDVQSPLEPPPYRSNASFEPGGPGVPGG